MHQANSMGNTLGRAVRCVRRHRPVLLVAVLILVFFCFSLVSAEEPAGTLAQSAVLAAVAVAATALSDARVLALPSRKTASTIQSDETKLGRWTRYVLAVGLAAGIAAVVFCGAMPPTAAPAALDEGIIKVGGGILLCLLTGVFEEGVFRAVALDALMPAFKPSRHRVLLAALVSSALFGMLHISMGEVSSLADPIMVAQACIKPLQAGLFGLFMAALFMRSRNLWVVAGVHGAFNVLYTGPALLSGVPDTYVTGSPVDLVLLVATTALLVVPAIVAGKSLLAVEKTQDSSSNKVLLPL